MLHPHLYALTLNPPFPPHVRCPLPFHCCHLFSSRSSSSLLPPFTQCLPSPPPSIPLLSQPRPSVTTAFHVLHFALSSPRSPYQDLCYQTVPTAFALINIRFAPHDTTHYTEQGHVFASVTPCSTKTNVGNRAASQPLRPVHSPFTSLPLPVLLTEEARTHSAD